MERGALYFSIGYTKRSLRFFEKVYDSYEYFVDFVVGLVLTTLIITPVTYAIWIISLKHFFSNFLFQTVNIDFDLKYFKFRDSHTTNSFIIIIIIIIIYYR